MGAHEKAQEAAERVLRGYRRRVLRSVIAREAELDKVYTEVADRLRKRLQLTTWTVAQIHAIVRQEFERSLEARVGIVERAIFAGARQGVAADRETFRAVFGEGGAPEELPFADASSSESKPTPDLRLVPESEDE